MTHPTACSQKDIRIIGAGIGGLVTALSLQKMGIKTSLYESREQNNAKGAGIILSINAMRVLDSIGIAEHVIKQGRVLSEICLASPNGSILSRNKLNQKSGISAICSVAIHRKDLHRILSEKLPVGTIQYGKKCIRVNTESNQCFFDDGTKIAFDLLIGCDGIHSSVRSSIGIIQPARDANQVCYRGLATLKENNYQLDRFAETWGHAKRFGFVNIGQKNIYWYATLRKETFGETTPNQAKAALVQEFSKWWGPIPEIINQQDELTLLRNDLYDRKPSLIWYNENVVLLGDAIHATTPNTGQGAAMAIESAAVLAQCLAKTDTIADALYQYQILRAPRTKEITELSWKIGKFGNLNGRLACHLRNSFLRIMPNRIANKGANAFFNHNVLDTVDL